MKNTHALQCVPRSVREANNILLVLLLTLPLLAGCGTELAGSGSADTGTATNGATDGKKMEVEWKQVRTGLSYAVMHLPAGKSGTNKDLLVASIDPRAHNFSIFENASRESAKTIKEIHGETGSLVTFNGGFFTEEFKPTGLLISGGGKIRDASGADLLNGILAIDEAGKAKLFGNRSSLNEKKYVFAIQNGPVLLNEKGEITITAETGKSASRTAVGVDKNGNIILIVLKQSLLNPDNQITLFEFAHLLKEAPELAKLGLHSMLNLDGGPSSGMMIDDRYFPEMEKVQNVVIIKPRTT